MAESALVAAGSIAAYFQCTCWAKRGRLSLLSAALAPRRARIMSAHGNRYWYLKLAGGVDAGSVESVIKPVLDRVSLAICC